jgi:DNA-binding MurR/RpiR family transcriptional regulator
MNGMTVSETPPAPEDVLAALSAALDRLTPEARKAAVHVLEHPGAVGVSSVREMAAAAGVKPNTLVRMARAVGFAGYDDLREPFRAAIRQGGGGFGDRAESLQTVARQGGLAGLYAEMARSAAANIEDTFARTGWQAVKAAADAIAAARRVDVLGVGLNHPLARNVAYLCDMAGLDIRAIPREGNLAADEVARLGEGDVLVALTFRPYRAEVVEAVAAARAQGAMIVGISDSPASPVVAGSAHGFVVATATPQFFTSTVAVSALLETLVAFVIADAGEDVIEAIERFHARRHALGIYLGEGGGA